MSKLCAVLLAAALIVSTQAHRITVKGTFYCDSNPNPAAYLELREKDAFEDDVLNWKLVRGDEDFEIDGHDDEIFSIEPYLKIRHNCAPEPREITRKFGKVRGTVTKDLEQVLLDGEEEND